MIRRRPTRLGGGLEHHDTLVGEQRRTEQFGKLGGADLARTQPIDRHIIGARLFACLSKDGRDRSLDKQLFVTKHQVQARDLFAHPTIVSWPLHRCRGCRADEIQSVGSRVVYSDSIWIVVFR